MGKLLLTSGQVSLLLSSCIGTLLFFHRVSITTISWYNAPTLEYCPNNPSFCIYSCALPLRLCHAAANRVQYASSDKTEPTETSTSGEPDITADAGHEMGQTDGWQAGGG